MMSASNPADPAVLRIDAGGPAYTDVLGHRWAADSAVGGTVDRTPFPIFDTPDPKLLTSRRMGNFTYTLSVPAGSYALEFLFAEASGAPGQRVFDVAADGKPLLTLLDVAATVGIHTAMMQTLPLSITSGPLVLKFIGVKGEAMLSGLALFPNVPPRPAPSTLNILPLGDSITYGAMTQAYPSGGYRSQLYRDLVDHGRSILFQGSVYDTSSATLEKAGEAWYEGHGGYTIEQISANFDGFGAGNPASPNNGGHWINGTGARKAIYPNIVLLHAGTNDILERHSGASTASAMDALINKITSERPSTVLFVAEIIPLVDAAKNTQVKAYNTLLRTRVVPKYQKLGRHVVLVDQYQNFVDAKGNVLSGHFPDGVHPDQAGYNLMANTWYAAIEAYETKHGAAVMAGLG